MAHKVYTFVSPTGGAQTAPLELVSMDMNTGVILSTYSCGVRNVTCEAAHVAEEVKRARACAVVLEFTGFGTEILTHQIPKEAAVRKGTLRLTYERRATLEEQPKISRSWTWYKLLETAGAARLEAWIDWDAE